MLFSFNTYITLFNIVLSLIIALLCVAARNQKLEKKINDLENVKKITSANETMEKLVNITNGIKIVTAVILAGLVVGAIFIISNTIKLTVYARRKEISIMKYVGATNSFIRWPFIVEGIVIGILSACISILLIGGGYKVIATKLLESNFIQNLGITLVSFNDMFSMIIIVYLVLGIGIDCREKNLMFI